jgi:acyl-CoA synthetase (AMP-forming)/AMP-acid ligase II/3-hydroxymyristoyl/3-hydroxydecanoyl-(acyl carrier protein) dehydratase
MITEHFSLKRMATKQTIAVQDVTPISRLFTRPKDKELIVAVGDQETCDWQKFSRDVSVLATRLAVQSRCHWLVADTNAYALAVGVFAALHAGGHAVLPANLQRGHLTDLAAKVDGVVTSSVDLAGAVNIFDTPPAGALIDLEPLDPENAKIILHTSGTTGDPVAEAKPLRCFDAEIRDLTQTFAPFRNETVHATVPPYHIYGLLFRVLWPLATARAFSMRLISYPEQLSSAAQESEGCMLVSSPAFLKRVLPVLDLNHLKTRLGAVFSSGGPLSSDVAAQYNATLTKPVVEVYGSTETGGIAYRSTTNADAPEPWHPLPSVTVAIDSDDGILSVRSPFLPQGDWHQTSDRASLQPDGRFVLAGRADRIVKLEEQRVSLTEIERRLDACNLVETARVVQLPVDAGKRQILGAVVEPTTDGWDKLATKGRRALRGILMDELKSHLTAIALPRQWRFVTRLPEDGRGKTSDAALLMLFEKDQGQRIEPVVLAQETGRDSLSLRLSLPNELFYFEGHFDEAPILPGVVQVDWAMEFAAVHFAIPEGRRRIEALKFFKILQAGAEVTLDLQYSPEKARLTFQYSTFETKFSSGRVIIEAHR